MFKFIAALALLFAVTAQAEIADFPNAKYHLRAGFEQPQYSLTFNGEGSEVHYRPNTLMTANVGVNIRDFFGFSLGLPIPQDGDDRKQMGKSTYTDLRFNLAFEQFMLYLAYGQYKGFYVEEDSSQEPGWQPGDPFYQREDLTARTLAATFSWVFQPEDFSLIAALDQTKRQMKPGGSWLAGGSVIDTLFKADSEIIPTAVQVRYGGDGKMTEGHFTAVNVKGGYGYTHVFANPKYFLSGAMQGGYGLQAMHVSGTGFDRNRALGTVKVDGFFAFGWSGDEHYFGLNALADLTKFSTGESTIDVMGVTVKMFYGFRLDGKPEAPAPSTVK